MKNSTKPITTNTNKTIIKIDDYLFDVTEYKTQHPGGKKLLEKFHNKDATMEFNKIRGHCDTYVYYILDKLCMGKCKNKL